MLMEVYGLGRSPPHGNLAEQSCGLPRKSGSPHVGVGGREGEGERQKEKGRGQLSAPAAQPGPWCLSGPGLSWAREPPLFMLRTDYERREAALSSPAVVMATLPVSFPSCGF